MQTQTIRLLGLTCSACKKITEKRLGSIPGVAKVEVGVDSGTAVIQSENGIAIGLIIEVLQDTHYTVIT
mgnify:FL=1